MDKIAALIPCYNEEKGISKVIDDFKLYLPEAVIYVYDNNSSDRTVELAVKGGAIVRHEPKQGKGNVVRSMFKDVDAMCYIMVDGDDTYDLSKLKEMARRVLEENDDMVIGDRLSGTYFQENKRPLHGFGNKIVRDGVNVLFNCHNPDIMTGLRAFSYTYVKSFPAKADGFQVETEMSIFAALNKLKTSSVVIGFKDRPEDSFSKVNTIKDGAKILNFMFLLFVKNKPLMFFIPLFVVFLFLGLGFLIPACLDCFDNKTLAVVLSTISLIFGLANLCIGLCLNNKKKKTGKESAKNIENIRSEYLTKINSKMN